MSAKKEAKDMEKVFKKFDANDDGRIWALELEILLIALGSETSKEEVRRMMSEMDKDGDGFIDLKEFAEFHRRSKELIKDSGNGNRKLREAFGMYSRRHSATEIVNCFSLIVGVVISKLN